MSTGRPVTPPRTAGTGTAPATGGPAAAVKGKK
jgi:hypothetical protein